MSLNEVDTLPVNEKSEDKFEAFFSLDNPPMKEDVKKMRSISSLTKTGPGYLESDNQIEIHSKQAYGLLLGNNGSKKKPPRVGLFAFASITNALIKASKSGNPFADKLLIHLEHHLEKLAAVLLTSKETFKYKQSELSEQGINIKLMFSQRPHLVSVKFYSPYAYEILLRIIDFDRLTRLYLPLRQMRIIDSAEFYAYFSEPRRIFGQCVNTTAQFQVDKYGGITRRSYLEHLNTPDPTIKKAISQFGSIDEKIILGQSLPSLVWTNKKDDQTNKERSSQ